MQQTQQLNVHTPLFHCHALWTLTLLFTFMLTFSSVSQASTTDNAPAYSASTESALLTMNDQYAIVFFFRSDCSWCHKFAPALTRFTQKNDLFTYAFSLDGRGMPGYEVPIPASNDISTLFFSNPRSVTVPATFLINVNTQKFIKVSEGAVSERELQKTLNNILASPVAVEAMQ